MRVIVILMDETATSGVVIYCDIENMTDQGETSGYEATSDPLGMLRPGQSRSENTREDETAERNGISGLVSDHRIPDAGGDRSTCDWLYGSMNDSANMFFAMLQRLFSGACNGWTILAGVEPNGKQHVAKGRIAAPGNAAHTTPVATVILFHVKAGHDRFDRHDRSDGDRPHTPDIGPLNRRQCQERW